MHILNIFINIHIFPLEVLINIHIYTYIYFFLYSVAGVLFWHFKVSRDHSTFPHLFLTLSQKPADQQLVTFNCHHP